MSALRDGAVDRIGRACAGIALMTLAACGGDTPAGHAAVGNIVASTAPAAVQVLNRGLDDTPRSLDPDLSTDVQGQNVIDDLFEGLTTVGEDGSVVPGVAQSWEVTPDAKIWTFHLRPEARWSNGDPVRAADFLFAWRRIVNPKTGSEYAQSLAPIANAMAIATGKAPVQSLGAAAPDPLTVRITLAAPTPYILNLLADNYLMPLHRATLERYGDDWTRPANIVSNGPYVLKEFIIGNRITLEKNPRYWAADGVRITKVTFFAITDSLTQVSRFTAGDLDFTSSFPSTQFRWIKSQFGDQVHIGPYLGVTMLAFNMVEPPFALNRNLRLAVSMALDRKVLADKIRQGLQLPAYTLMPPLPGYQQQLPAWAAWDDERRHAEARRLYTAAGYSKQRPLRVQLLYPTSDDNRDLFDAVAAMLRMNLGAEIEPYNEEFRVELQDLRLHKSKFFQNAWIGDFPDPFTFMQLFTTGFDQNFSAYADPSFDALLHAASLEPELARRFDYFQQAERRLNDQAPYIPMFYYTTRHLAKPYLKGWTNNILDRNPTRYMYLLEHSDR
jgi:oligopeptide transport system substrate-binding protein